MMRVVREDSGSARHKRRERVVRGRHIFVRPGTEEEKKKEKM